jgi:6-phosphogluconolactonase
MNALTEHIFDSDDALLAALYALVTGTLRDAIATRGRATLAVSGGNTPRPLFARLAQTELAWNKVDITLVDERWVDISDDASNEKMLRSTLLAGPAGLAHFVPLKNSAASAAAGVPAAAAALAQLVRPFDLVMLGMGDDGHTASLFPGAPQLAEGLATKASCLAVTPPAAPHERITLSAHQLLDTRRLVLHISGAQKLRALHEALADGPVEDHPIRFFLRQLQVPMDIYASR